ncbi:MAG: metalloregulator ArsR/SmtB family transcription factor [Novosphingobium sp.]|nr:metalloregulator ArsR/SmtB family transcription factor [Novosphingobium sp.]
MNVHSPGEIEERAELFRVLGHATRLNILCSIAGGELSVGELADRTALGMSMLSQQLAVLRRAGLVTTRREGKQVYYAIDAEPLGALRAALDALLPAASDAGKGNGRPARGEEQLGAAMFARIRPPRR